MHRFNIVLAVVAPVLTLLFTGCQASPRPLLFGGADQLSNYVAAPHAPTQWPTRLAVVELRNDPVPHAFDAQAIQQAADKQAGDANRTSNTIAADANLVAEVQALGAMNNLPTRGLGHSERDDERLQFETYLAQNPTGHDLVLVHTTDTLEEHFDPIAGLNFFALGLLPTQQVHVKARTQWMLWDFNQQGVVARGMLEDKTMQIANWHTTRTAITQAKERAENKSIAQLPETVAQALKDLAMRRVQEASVPEHTLQPEPSTIDTPKTTRQPRQSIHIPKGDVLRATTINAR